MMLLRQQVLQQLHMGVALPLLVYADTGFVERYQQAGWQQALMRWWCE